MSESSLTESPFHIERIRPPASARCANENRFGFLHCAGKNDRWPLFGVCSSCADNYSGMSKVKVRWPYGEMSYVTDSKKDTRGRG